MSQRISNQKLQWVSQELTPSDKKVIDFLYNHRFATTRHISRLLRPQFANHASSIRQAARLTQKLRRYGLVNHLERRIGGARAGSTGYIWFMTEAGHRCMRLINADQTNETKRKRATEPSWQFLAHTLAITELRITTEEVCRCQPISIVMVETEPACWRNRLGDAGHIEWIKPDLSLITSTQGYLDHWWFEVDMSTERPSRLKHKANMYLKHLYSGTEQASRGVFPKVIWLTPTSERSCQLHELFASIASLPSGIFEVMEMTQWATFLSRTTS